MKFKVQGRNLMLTEASHKEMKTLEFFLTRKADNYRFHPLYKKGQWDGNISFFKAKRYIPSGLWKELLQLCKDNNFPFDIDKSGFNQLFETQIQENEFKSWVMKKFQGEKKPRPYQTDAAWKIIKGKACIAELATSAGKSFIIFLIIAFLFEKGYEQKFLMIVPTIQLVLQAISDFEDYKTWATEPIDVDFKFQGIHSGMSVKAGVNVVVGTYQTLVKKKKPFFESFGIIGCDECHTAKAVSIQKILEKCPAHRRFGVTGTIPKPDSINRLNIMSNLGPCVYVLKAKDLIEQDYITNVNIRCLKLDYKDSEFKHALYNVSKHQDGKFMLEKEKNIVIDSKKRLNFIIRLLENIKENTLVLFSRIEYGNKLYNQIREELKDRDVLYVDGSVDKDLREEVRADMEIGSGKILIASFGTFSTGVNIKNIHNIIFTESFKSDVIIRQSIGRGLRKHKNKSILTIYDLIDDFTIPTDKAYKNRLLYHGLQRMKIYKEQSFTYQINRITI